MEDPHVWYWGHVIQMANNIYLKAAEKSHSLKHALERVLACRFDSAPGGSLTCNMLGELEKEVVR